MRKIRTRVSLFALSFLATGLTLGAVFVGKSKAVVTYGYTNGDAATYYSGISNTAIGNDLLSALQTLNTSKRRSLVGYNSMPSKFTQTDPGTSSGQVTSFYSGTSAKYSGNMNREHTWPASRTIGGRGNDPLEDDIHMTRPTLTSDNSSRGNSLYTYPSERGWDPGSLGDETYRGDAARIIFYCVVADSRLGMVDRDIDASSNHTMGKLSTLLEWNLTYPVKNRENVRNEAAEQLQGNRNPFIDHPEYACRIWGNTNATTKAICGSAPVPVDPTVVTDINIDIVEAEMKSGETLQLTVTAVPDTATLPELIWGSTNSKVATVVDGLVTARKAGNCTINALTVDGKFMVSCDITVDGGAKPSKASGCGGNVVTTSSILSAISLLGVGLILFKSYKKREQ